MLRLHGGTLTTLYVRMHPNSRVEALARLVQRQLALEEVVVLGDIPALSHLLKQGCLCSIRELYVAFDKAFEVEDLVVAMQVPGTLQALESLDLQPEMYWERGRLPLLAGALAADAAPSLRTLTSHHCLEHDDEDVDALTAMLEGRTHRPACRGILAGIEFCTKAACRRLMRALLPSLVELDDGFDWDPAYETAILKMRPLCLTTCKVMCPLDTLPSVEVWEAMPNVEELVYEVTEPRDETFYDSDDDGDEGAPQAMELPLISALTRGVAFQRLQKLALREDVCQVADWDGLLGALAGAQCATQLTSLELPHSCWRAAPMATFAELMSQDVFPLLRRLVIMSSSLYYHSGTEDAQVAVLARGLQEASRIRLKELHLNSIGVGDAGMAALAGVLHAGHFEQLENISISGNNNVSDKGVCLWARAAQDTGLPMLSEFHAKLLSKVTTMGVAALGLALLTKCPRLTLLDLSHHKDGVEAEVAMAAGLVHAADCRHRVEFKV